ncbi:hypothetical protein ACIPLC_11710 [Kitasatospora sp. NPDC086801]|uniref:hypothetical protein n=1 Tax=Kitasatospora sp. NPDC086801 TaxID=3364066 RepID=UPI0037F3855C
MVEGALGRGAKAIAEVRVRYLGDECRAGRGTYAQPAERYQDVRARSVEELASLQFLQL